ncbi:hypothetical protein [Actinomadura sp. HBU206391]|uniref:hypothetical protein n=1 Tax=Actinomadura sp. HBU206391 TaxID=2731692 RepID=UPI001650073A|nr:hypothetical protein [Actinomadura sp. HBU206391]MBC6457755.1 hypothetical protein [Actinomadura sp. HBU206391]
MGPDPALPPGQPVVLRPENPCYGSIENDYGELTATIPVRYIDVRGGSRIGYQIRKIVKPGQPDKWQVQIYGWGELSAATPGVPETQLESDDPLGIDPRKLELPAGIWIGGNLTLGDTYEFDSEKEATGFPWEYAEKRLRQFGDAVISSHPVTGPLVGLAKHLPWVGDDIEKVLEGDPLPPRKEWSLEAGPTGGFTGKMNILKVGGSLGMRGWRLLGVRHAANGESTFTVRDSGEVEPSIIIDLGTLLPPSVRNRFNGKVNEGIDELEKLAAKKFGAGFRLPAKMREHLKKNWPDLGVTAKAKGTITYQVTMDRNGDPVRFTKLVDTQLNWYGRLADKVSTKNQRKEVAGNLLVPLGGHRTIEQSTLGLNDSANLRAVQDFGLYAPLGVGAELTPAADRLRERFEAAGTTTRQSYDSDAGNVKISGNAASRRGSVLGELKLEVEDNRLSGAEIWESGKGWVPWTACHG